MGACLAMLQQASSWGEGDAGAIQGSCWCSMWAAFDTSTHQSSRPLPATLARPAACALQVACGVASGESALSAWQHAAQLAQSHMPQHSMLKSGVLLASASCSLALTHSGSCWHVCGSAYMTGGLVGAVIVGLARAECVHVGKGSSTQLARAAHCFRGCSTALMMGRATCSSRVTLSSPDSTCSRASIGQQPVVLERLLQPLAVHARHLHVCSTVGIWQHCTVACVQRNWQLGSTAHLHVCSTAGSTPGALFGGSL